MIVQKPTTRPWRRHFGKGYDVEHKHAELKPFLAELDRRGHLGNVIIDAGSGSKRMSSPFGGTRSGIFTPEGKTVVRVDIAAPYDFNVEGKTIEVRGDIQDPKPRTFSQRKTFVRLLDALNAPAKNGKCVDTLLFSDVLNYVDFRKAINGLGGYLKPGGRIVVYNRPRRGYVPWFSRKGVKTNDSLVEFLKQRGFTIEHLTESSDEAAKVYPVVRQVTRDDQILLVARKTKS